MDVAADILKLLSLSAVKEIRLETIKTLLALTGDEDGLKYLCEHLEYVPALLKLTENPESPEYSYTLQCLINMAVKEQLAKEVLKNEETKFFDMLLEKLVKGEGTQLHSMLLCNLSHSEKCCSLIFEKLSNSRTYSLDALIDSFCKSTPHSNYDHLASVLANLSRLSEVRKYLMNPKKELISRLLPFTTYSASPDRRIGIIRTLRNCCFETAYHEWLLKTADIIPPVVLPLAGPEEFDDDEMEKLPLDLQYLEPTKTREDEPEIRKLLLEILTLLCATKFGREFIRNSGIYVILRELHKWEKSRPVTVCCENLVDIIIGDEPSPEMANLLEVQVPEDLQKKFDKFSDELLKQS